MQAEIERLFDERPQTYTEDDFRLFQTFRAALNAGSIRAAEPDPSTKTGWRVNTWVKKGILLGFRMGTVVDMSINSGRQPWLDKATFPVKQFTPADGVRIVPGGSSIRRGAYIGKGVVMMPPAFVNIGAYVDEDTMIDSHALVGSCAQVGKRVHVSAAAQIGGVLEPIGNVPVVIEDDVVVGGNSGVYEGTIVRARAVIGAGVVLTASTPVYDTVRGVVHRREIPSGAVVIPGSRRMKGEFAEGHGLSVATPVIVKYRDEKTDSATALEEALR